MPVKSERSTLIAELENLLRHMIIEGDDKSSEFIEIMDIYVSITGSRYLNERTVIPKTRALVEVMLQFEEREFKVLARCDKASFIRLVEMIEDHPVFDKDSRHKQSPVWLQLLVVLNRLGSDGNGASIQRIAMFNGISYGSVDKFTQRVFTAIRSLEAKYVYWPNPEERARISRRMGILHGLPGAVGIVDGTPVNLEQRPGIDGAAYFSRKSRYCINLQLVCDDTKRITHYLTGWPGSQFDSQVFDKSILCTNPLLCFSPGEFLMADAGYALRFYICTPYRKPAALIPENQVFNILFSTARVKIEHVNGILKARFGSLKGLRIHVTKLDDFVRINEWIVVCIILYNILHSFNDEWDEDIDEEEVEDEASLPHADTTQGDNLRTSVQLNLLNWYYK